MSNRQNLNPTIVVIGSRGSGKTTYLASLAYWPQKLQEDNKTSKFLVRPNTDSDTQSLVAKAETIILERKSMGPTIVPENLSDINQIPRYNFFIDLQHPFQKQQETINLITRDYPGEILEDIHSPKAVQQLYLEECFDIKIDGCLLMLDRWEPGSDKFYRSAIEAFVNLLDEKGRIKDYKVAAVMSKCERGELWSSRLTPEIDIFASRLKETTKILKTRLPANNLQFFALSTFGVLARDDPRPNRKVDDNKDYASLRYVDKWKPYGTIAPLYWLAKNKKLKSV
jgi:GTPase SAR1 family protein